jgi:hypothetical protein
MFDVVIGFLLHHADQLVSVSQGTFLFGWYHQQTPSQQARPPMLRSIEQISIIYPSCAVYALVTGLDTKRSVAE